LLSVGSAPVLSALETMLAMLESLNEVPKVFEDMFTLPAYAMAPDTFPVVSP
jgi:hypothetical protein